MVNNIRESHLVHGLDYGGEINEIMQDHELSA